MIRRRRGQEHQMQGAIATARKLGSADIGVALHDRGLDSVLSRVVGDRCRTVALVYGAEGERVRVKGKQAETMSRIGTRRVGGTSNDEECLPVFYYSVSLYRRWNAFVLFWMLG